MSSISFGKSTRNRTASSFVPFHIDKILESPVVDLLAAQARNARLNQLTSSINIDIWNLAFYYSVLTSVWRYFPTITPAAIARDARSHTSHIQQLKVSLEMQAVAFQFQLSTLRKSNLKVLEGLFGKCNGKLESGHLKRRDKAARFPGLDGRMYFCSQPSVGMKWIAQTAKTELSGDPYRRLAESWLIAISLLAVHPFSNGNGRLSRLLFNALCSAGTRFPIPLAVFFLLKNGRSLYNELIKRILDGQEVALCPYFDLCINHCATFCRAAQRIQTEDERTLIDSETLSSEDQLSLARDQLQSIYVNSNRDELSRLAKIEPLVYGGS